MWPYLEALQSRGKLPTAARELEHAVRSLWWCMRDGRGEGGNGDGDSEVAAVVAA